MNAYVANHSNHASNRARNVLARAIQPSPRANVGNHDDSWISAGFATVSLAELNAKAEMLERRDNKYVVGEATLRRALPMLAKHFDMLEIDGRRAFTYETCYFDDAALNNYFDQLLDRPQRFKIRTRRYTDSGLCFVEFKLKEADSTTVKERRVYPLDRHGQLDASAWQHIRDAYRRLTGREFSRRLDAVVDMRYQRITLVAKQGGERMTIDRSLVFTGANGAVAADPGAFIIETKSANADGLADAVFANLAERPVASCSKYCLALAALGEVEDFAPFLPAMRRLGCAPRARTH